MKKTQIPLSPSQGRSAMGVVDTTGTLKSGEVFFCCSTTLSPKSAPRIITGRVAVTRSPINHAGDIRFFQAVDVPALHHLTDVVVFPIRGDRPHTDEIGGGDCDGDFYDIIWHPGLILCNSVKAGDFTDFSSQKVSKINIKDLAKKHPIFRAEYEVDNSLGFTSSCSLAHTATQNPRSNEFEKLAQKVDVALNYPKNGEAPARVEEYERHTFWPNFMDKKHEPAYTTPHILSEFYEKSSDFHHMISIVRREAEKRRNEMKLDDKVDVPISDFTKNKFNEYRQEIEVGGMHY